MDCMKPEGNLITIRGLEGDLHAKKARYIAETLHRSLPNIYLKPDIKLFTEANWYEYYLYLKRFYNYKELPNTVVVFINGKFLGEEIQFIEFIRQYCYFHPTLEPFNVTTDEDVLKQYGINPFKSCVFFDIAVNKKVLGRMVFEIQSDYLPRTCKTFLELCRNATIEDERELLRKKGLLNEEYYDTEEIEHNQIIEKYTKELRGHKGPISTSYKGSKISRIMPTSWIEFGEVRGQNKYFKIDGEVTRFSHNKRGVLSLNGHGKYVHTSKLVLSLSDNKWMDYAFGYRAIGHLLSGESVLKILEQLPTNYGDPLDKVEIYDCGVLYSPLFPKHDKLTKEKTVEMKISSEQDRRDQIFLKEYEALVKEHVTRRKDLPKHSNSLDEIRFIYKEKEDEDEETTDGADAHPSEDLLFKDPYPTIADVQKHAITDINFRLPSKLETSVRVVEGLCTQLFKMVSEKGLALYDIHDEDGSIGISDKVGSIHESSSSTEVSGVEIVSEIESVPMVEEEESEPSVQSEIEDEFKSQDFGEQELEKGEEEEEQEEGEEEESNDQVEPDQSDSLSSKKEDSDGASPDLASADPSAASFKESSSSGKVSDTSHSKSRSDSDKKNETPSSEKDVGSKTLTVSAGSLPSEATPEKSGGGSDSESEDGTSEAGIAARDLLAELPDYVTPTYLLLQAKSRMRRQGANIADSIVESILGRIFKHSELIADQIHPEDCRSDILLPETFQSVLVSLPTQLLRKVEEELANAQSILVKTMDAPEEKVSKPKKKKVFEEDNSGVALEILQNVPTELLTSFLNMDYSSLAKSSSNSSNEVAKRDDSQEIKRFIETEEIKERVKNTMVTFPKKTSMTWHSEVSSMKVLDEPFVNDGEPGSDPEGSIPKKALESVVETEGEFRSSLTSADKDRTDSDKMKSKKGKKGGLRKSGGTRKSEGVKPRSKKSPSETREPKKK